MPSRADRVDVESFDGAVTTTRRAIAERVLRGASLLLLVLLVWQALHALRERPAARANGSGIRPALERWSTAESPSRVHVVFDSATVPSPDVRDWLAALRSAHTQTTWFGPALVPSAIGVTPVADPKHPVRVWVAAPRGSAVVLRDALGVIDSTRVRGAAGAVFTTSHVDGVVRATLGDRAAGSAATALLRDSLTIKPVLVLGIASWEGKFILASLQEYGWKVDARFGLSPKGDVVQGSPALVIDTAHYSAVIALDTSAARYARSIDAYVRHGGGFIASGVAATLPAFAELLPGTAGAPLQDAPFETDSAHPRRALAVTPISRLRPGAVAIETRTGASGAVTTVAARRIGMGRVLQVGYLDSWRWRMGGFDDPVSGYRSWWSKVVSSVAYAPRAPRPVSAIVEPTPVATLVATLGTPSRQEQARGTLLDDPRLLPILFALLMAMLFAEWTSRRLRGQS
jgi:hypothetical protein